MAVLMMINYAHFSQPHLSQWSLSETVCLQWRSAVSSLTSMEASLSSVPVNVLPRSLKWEEPSTCNDTECRFTRRCYILLDLIPLIWLEMWQQCCGDAQQMHRGQYGSRESSTHCNLRSYANKTQADEENLSITNTTNYSQELGVHWRHCNAEHSLLLWVVTSLMFIWWIVFFLLASHFFFFFVPVITKERPTLISLWFGDFG